VQQEQGEPGRLTYCADTSALFDLKEHWQMGVFPSLWTRIDRIVAEGRLFAPQAVLEEIRRGDDELVAWATSRPGMFRPLSAEVLLKAKEILARFPDLVDSTKRHEDADPYVVAQAVLEGESPGDLLSPPSICAVLTQEHRRIGRIRIPHACAAYGIECFDFRELFRRESIQI
jgi:hypothetical protein